jgi:hypothetical protein
MKEVSAIPELAISPAKVAAIIARARQFATLSVLENHNDDPVQTELTAIIRGLNEDEQVDLVALTWLGRGDGELDNWDDIRAEAVRAHNRRTAQYLLGMPLLGDYLEEALTQFGHSAEEFEQPI